MFDKLVEIQNIYLENKKRVDIYLVSYEKEACDIAFNYFLTFNKEEKKELIFTFFNYFNKDQNNGNNEGFISIFMIEIFRQYECFNFLLNEYIEEKILNFNGFKYERIFFQNMVFKNNAIFLKVFNLIKKEIIVSDIFKNNQHLIFSEREKQYIIEQITTFEDLEINDFENMKLVINTIGLVPNVFLININTNTKEEELNFFKENIFKFNNEESIQLIYKCFFYKKKSYYMESNNNFNFDFFLNFLKENKDIIEPLKNYIKSKNSKQSEILIEKAEGLLTLENF